jgi:unsaturated rhamnogalacturonyl hydrolase
LWWTDAAGDAASRRALVARYARLLDDGDPLVNRVPDVDQAVIGIVPLQVYLLTGDSAWLRQGLSFADEQWQDLGPDGLTRQARWWIDDMYMVGMLQMQAFRATGNAQYAARAARFVAAYLDRLQHDNGLVFHGPEAPIFWGRGNGWVAVALAEVLDGVPATDPRRPRILRAYLHMMQSLLGLQGADELWRQILDDPDA